MFLKSNDGASSSSRRSWKYDVFVSFRGEDTRRNFTDHLCAALKQKAIQFFRDDEKLGRGKPVSPELLKAIEASRFSLVVFSRNYATSSWCLDELLKIVECMKKIDQTVVPIFYDVNPSEVRKQTGSFEKAFEKHEKAVEAEKLEKWRGALTEVANLSGWDLKDEHEAAFIQKIVGDIWTKLNHSLISIVTRGLVGMDSPLKKMISYLDMGLYDVLIIGICGMGGIGKTTIAKIIYDMFSHEFEGSCFLSNIRESHQKSGLDALQEKLLSQTLKVKDVAILGVHGGIYKWLHNKRVFVVLDDVDKLEQLETLAGGHEWFGPGSRIIITTRDEQLLNAHSVDKIHKPQILNIEEALQLFSLNAFKQNRPIEDYAKLSKNFVSYANGLPLALKILGSYLCGRSINEWRSALKSLRDTPKREIVDVLKISYDGLEEIEKKIFLDISCLFNLKKRNRVIQILDACEFYSEIGLRVLIDKSLVSIKETNKNEFLDVHSLLQQMAQRIVYQESPEERGRRSRLWLYDDIYHVLKKKTGTEPIEVMYLSSSQSKEMFVDADAFVGMKNLRLLKIHDVQLPKGLHYLPDELRLLKWHGYPLKSLPSTFKPEKLVELDMSHSGIVLLWKQRVHFAKLKVIKLSHSRKLTRIQDFRGFPKLERLILEGCTSLYKVHPSIGDLESLILLNLKDCESLQSLPRIVYGWRSLKVLLLVGCSQIDKLPENLGDCEDLEELDAGKTAITEAPSFIVTSKNLKKLSFCKCKGQTRKRKHWNWFLPFSVGGGPISLGFSLPSQISGLLSLTNLDLSYCNLFAIPNDFGNLSALRNLDLRGNEFVDLPASFNQLSKLTNLDLTDCNKLQTLSQLPSSIEWLEAVNCSSLKTLISPLGLPISGCRDFIIENCFRLLENEDVALSLLKDHILSLTKIKIRQIFLNFLNYSEKQESNDPHIARLAKFVRSRMSYLPLPQIGSSRGYLTLRIILPGSSISDWFIFQTTNNWITIELPPNWCSDHTFLGLALCASFGVKEREGPEKTKGVFDIGVSCKNHNDNFDLPDTRRSMWGDELSVSNFLWLGFLVPDMDFPVFKAKRFRFQCSYFEFKKLGIRAVYLKDIEFIQTMFQGLNVPHLEDIIQQSQPQTARSTIFEQSREIHFHNDDAGPSGTSSDFDDKTADGGSGYSDNNEIRILENQLFP